MKHRKRKVTNVQSEIIVMTGGLKQDVSQLELKGGDLIDCLNYQEIDGVYHGYSSVSGYERFDGQELASSIDAPYDAEAGTWDDTDREAQRALITEVPGSGPVRAVGVLNGIVGAVRDNAAGTAADLFASTPTGWSAAIGGAPILYFDAGKDVAATPIGFQGGDTITGSVSGASATLLHQNLGSGLWSGAGTAKGLLVLDTISSPPFVAADVLSNGGTVTATILAASDPEGLFHLEAGGTYNLAIAAFDELVGAQRVDLVYSANGVNEPSYFNGLAQVPIIDINLPDAQGVYAVNIIEFKNRLWLAYPDGRLWYSGVGNPHEWDVATGGAGEIYLEDEITNLVVGPGDVLVVFCRNSTQIIKTITDSGSVTANTIADYAFFNETYSKRSGAIRNTTARLLGDVYFLDDRGMTNLSATDTYGDFASSSISKNVQRILIAKKNTAVTAGVQREFNQYRLFFGDRTGYSFTFDKEKKVKGITQFKYLHQISCFAEGEDTDGTVLLVFGSDDGYVYQMDSGTSFDGQEIATFMAPAYYSYRSPTNWKWFRKATIEMQGETGLVLHTRPYFNYKETAMPSSIAAEYVMTGTGTPWGTAAWGSFIWGGGTDTPKIYLTGYGTNMSLQIRTSSKYAMPHTINSMIVEYSRHARKM